MWAIVWAFAEGLPECGGVGDSYGEEAEAQELVSRGEGYKASVEGAFYRTRFG